MFDYIKQRDPKVIAFYWGCVPFAILWLLHNSLWTVFLFESYLITGAVFVLLPFELQRQDAKQRWFWTAMFRNGAIIHPPVLGVLWLLDATFPAIFVEGSTTLFVVAILVGAGESSLLNSIVGRSRPVEERASPPTS